MGSGIWKFLKYFSISKLKPSPAVRQTGWVFKRCETCLLYTSLLVLILVLAVALGTNGHRVAVHIDVDVLFLEARQISFQQVAVALVLNVGLKPVSYTHLDVYKRQPCR